MKGKAHTLCAGFKKSTTSSSPEQGSNLLNDIEANTMRKPLYSKTLFSRNTLLTSQPRAVCAQALSCMNRNISSICSTLYPNAVPSIEADFCLNCYGTTFEISEPGHVGIRSGYQKLANMYSLGIWMKVEPRYNPIQDLWPLFTALVSKWIWNQFTRSTGTFDLRTWRSLGTLNQRVLRPQPVHLWHCPIFERSFV